MSTIIAIITAFIGALALTFFISKCKYKVRHGIDAFLFFACAFLFQLHPVVSSHNGFIVWGCFLIGLWHLTKACFFIDTDETKKENS